MNQEKSAGEMAEPESRQTAGSATPGDGPRGLRVTLATGTVYETEPCVECPRCGRRSYNLHDIEMEYCGACHQFHEIMRHAGDAS